MRAVVGIMWIPCYNAIASSRPARQAVEMSLCTGGLGWLVAHGPRRGAQLPMQTNTLGILNNSELIAQLAALDVHHLRSLTITDYRTAVAPADLILALARHPDPRFREALIPLFLRRPQLAQLIPDILDVLDDGAADVLRHMYTAAVYLQRLWHGALSLYLRDFPLLPDYFGQTYFGLPAPAEYFGELGLYGLADYYHRRTGYDWRSLYKSIMALFLKQLSLNEPNHVQPVY